jgi:Skp family chaperone for outer membrane proteins
MMRAGALTALLLALCTTAAAQTVRCESPDGKVTYANVACPEGSKAVRTLPPADAPKPADAKAAQERLKADQQQAQKIDRQRQAEEDERARMLAAEAKKKDKRDLACRKLATQVSDAEEDLSRAAINKREAADLRLQKARRQYATECSG